MQTDPAPSVAEAEIATSTSGPFLGWRVLGASFTGQFLATAVTFAAFGVFVIPLSDEFETSRGQLNLALSIGIVAMAVLGPFVGTWLDRGLTRRLMLIGVTLSGFGLMGMSQATQLWQLGLLFCGVVAVGAALYGLTPTMALATNWFTRRRGLALGITVAGATVASFVAPPAAAWLVEHHGWRDSLLAFGATALLLGLPVFWRYSVARPSVVGQYPDGDDAPYHPDHPDASALPSESIPETSTLVRDPRLWMISVGFALVFTSPIVMMPTIIPFAEDLGMTAPQAALFFSAAAPLSLLSKLVFGALADHTPPRLAIWLVVLINAATWILLRFDPDYPEFLAIAALYGIGIGATGPLHAFVLARCFGPLAFGRASGIGGLAGLPLIAGTPALAGYLFDATGSYHTVFLVQTALLLMGGLLLSIPRIPRS